jgi:hypothetical protein
MKEIKRIENGEEIIYYVENESYVDEYGSYHMNYVPYRKDSKGKRMPLSSVHYELGPFEAEQYIEAKVKKLISKCEHCGHEEWS